MRPLTGDHPRGEFGTHSEDCWQWHHDCAIRRIEEVLALHAPVKMGNGSMVCVYCGVTMPCATVETLAGTR